MARRASTHFSYEQRINKILNAVSADPARVSRLALLARRHGRRPLPTGRAERAGAHAHPFAEHAGEILGGGKAAGQGNGRDVQA